jgi:hypothetical protein
VKNTNEAGQVVAVDPGALQPAVLARPGVTHLKVLLSAATY